MSEIDGINLPRWGAEDENETWGIIHHTDSIASMAELADAQVSKTCGEIRVGSSPSGGTNLSLYQW